MNNICTSLEQSKKLIELGINSNTADMYYSFDYNIEEYEEDAQIIPKSEFGEHFSLFPEDIPAWSLTALLNFIKPYGYSLSTSINKIMITINIPNNHSLCFYDNPIDAAFEMVCWLLENKKL